MSRYPLDIEDDDAMTNVVTVEITPEIERLARRPYRVEYTRDEDGSFIARVPELPGLVTHGATLVEMDAMVEDAKRGWIATAVHFGKPVPDPERIEATSTPS